MPFPKTFYSMWICVQCSTIFVRKNDKIKIFTLREAAKKKVHPLVAGPLRPYPPPPPA